MHILCKEAKVDHKQLNDHVKINLIFTENELKKWTLKIQKSKIVILVLNQCSISAVFQIVQLPGDQKTALTGESLYVLMKKSLEMNNFFSHQNSS